MGIVSEDISRVKEATDFVALVESRMALRKAGSRWSGLCPFHNEKTPSFFVNAENGLYHCFGCGASGDVISFVQATEGLGFLESVEFLAARAGITLRRTSHEDGREYRQRKELRAVLEQAMEWYHERLLSHPEAAQARGYLRSRGVDGEQVRGFKLGWASNARNTLGRALKIPSNLLRKTGLIAAGENPPDMFRARILFPIHDLTGNVLGFGGRSMPGGYPPKYKNSPESPLYTKSRVLYNLHRAKQSIVRADMAIISEGYTDVLALSGSGFENCVATCGTALTEDHVRALRRFTERFVLAFDADAAGSDAAARFYQWEAKHSVQVYVANLPPGSDPAELAREAPDQLKDALSEPVPFLAFRLERALQRHDLSTPEARARAGADALAVISEHPDLIVRDQYLMQISDRLHIPSEQLRASEARGARQQGGGSRMPEERTGDGAGQGNIARERIDLESIESQVLQLCIHKPESLPDYVSAEHFSSMPHRQVFEALRTKSTPGEAADLLRGSDASETPESRLLAALASTEPESVTPSLCARLLDGAAGRKCQQLQLAVRQTSDKSLISRHSDLLRAREELRKSGWEASLATELAELLAKSDVPAGAPG